MTDQMKAILNQYLILKKRPGTHVYFPDKKNPCMMHISFRGSPNSYFEKGIYHCRLDLSQYPQNAPRLCLINQNGSFEPN